MKRIFKWFTQSNSAAKVDWFVSSFPKEEFSNEDRLLYHYLSYCSYLGIDVKINFLEAFLKTESKKIIKSENIRLLDMGNFNYDEPAALEEATRVINNTVLAKFNLCMSEDLSERDFKVDMSTFMNDRYRERLLEIMTKAFSVINSGEDAAEVAENMSWDLQAVRNIYKKSKLHKLDFMEGDSYDKSKKGQMRHLFYTNLPCVDGDVGGAFSKQLIATAGAPGTGKTRLATIHFAYQCMVFAKKDVLFHELELSEDEIRNMLVSYHITQMFEGNIKIPDSLINQGKLTPSTEKYVEAARIDLFESGKYGQLHLLTEQLVVEQLEEQVYPLLRRNRNIQYWIIDYAGIARSKPVSKYDSALKGYEIIRELYMTVKDIISVADIGALIVNQFNNEGEQASTAGKAINAGHIEGGMIVARHSDYVIAATQTKEQKLANMMLMSTVKVRAAKGFSNVPYNLDLSISRFTQMKERATA
ncbi:MAG: hypothetical protein IJE43_19020 [Alphaproteobacteria bacterium]|nr:hypothetical protein [Alphaproteobacteria bacterium]